MDSGICAVSGFFVFIYSTLQNCLFFRQTGEGVRKQGKFPYAQMFSPDLSTKSVDRFSLASGRVTLQRQPGISRP
jgi:hypothetical protein